MSEQLLDDRVVLAGRDPYPARSGLPINVGVDGFKKADHGMGLDVVLIADPIHSPEETRYDVPQGAPRPSLLQALRPSLRNSLPGVPGFLPVPLFAAGDARDHFGG